jgi:membrane protein YdbS with pleckstrin-like domain
MSDIEIECPHCNQLLAVTPEMMGSVVECPSCSGALELPPHSEVEPEDVVPTPEAPKETKACEYCGEEVLQVAKKCKHCGEILDKSLIKERTDTKRLPQVDAPMSKTGKSTPKKETVQYEQHPSMFRNNPIGYILSLLMIVIGVGLLILIIWKLKCMGTTLTVTSQKTTLRTGLISKHTNEVFHSDVKNVQVSQRPLQRIFGVGTVRVSSAGQSDVEIEVSGIRQPAKVRDIINKYRDA